MPAIEITDFSGGLDLRPPHLIADNACQALGNCTIRDGVAARDVSTALVYSSRVNAVLWTDWYIREGGDPRLITFTRTDLFADNTDITGTALTGAATDLFQAASFAGKYYFTNNVDAPQEWANTGNHSALAGSPQFSIAKTVAAFQDRLFFANVTESAVAYPNRIRFSKVGDGSNWTDLTSGYIDIPVSSGQIVALYPLGDSLLVFTRQHVWRVYKISTPVYFDYTLLSSSIQLRNRLPSSAGNAAMNSIVHANDGLFFWGNDNVYFFNGSTFEAIGDPIWPYVYRGDSAMLTPYLISGGAEWENNRVIWTAGDEHLAYNWRTRHWECPFDDVSNDAPAVWGRMPYRLNTLNTDGLIGGIGLSALQNKNSLSERRDTALAAVNYQARLRTKAFGGAGRQSWRVNRVHVGMRGVTASVNTVTVIVTGYDQPEMLNFPTADGSIGTGSGGGTFRGRQQTRTFLANETTFADFDSAWGRWFDVELRDVNGQSTSAPRQLWATLVIEYEEMGYN